jgi:hypothetical protein
MGERKPKRLGVKLRHIRKHFGLSQEEMINEVGTDEYTNRSSISKFELVITLKCLCPSTAQILSP